MMLSTRSASFVFLVIFCFRYAVAGPAIGVEDLCRFGSPPLQNFNNARVVEIPLPLPNDHSPESPRAITGASINGNDGTLLLSMDDSSDASPPLIINVRVRLDEPPEVLFVVELQGFSNVEAVTWMYDSTIAVLEEHIPGMSVIDLSDAAIIQSEFGGDFRIISKEPGRNQAILQSFTIQYLPNIVEAGITGIAYDIDRGAFYAVDELAPKTIQEIQSDGYAYILRDVHNLVPLPGTLNVFEILEFSDMWMDKGSKSLIVLSSKSKTVTQFGSLGSTEDLYKLSLKSGLNLESLEANSTVVTGESVIPPTPSAIAFMAFPDAQQYGMVVAGGKTVTMWHTDCVDPRVPDPETGEIDDEFRGTCGNNVKDGLETGIDCGGFGCPTCASGQPCRGPSDCSSRRCMREMCTSVGAQDVLPPAPELSPYSPRPTASPSKLVPSPKPTVSPTMKGTSATAECTMQDGSSCPDDMTCLRGKCVDEAAVARCNNGKMDPDESGVDCGGECPPCGPEGDCVTDSDCLSGLTCSEGSKTCEGTVVGPSSSCFNGILDNTEIGVDCGGEWCVKCTDDPENPNQPTTLKGTHSPNLWYMGLVAAGAAVGFGASTVIARERSVRRSSQAHYEEMP